MARELGPGGSERQLTEIAKRLDRNRFLPYVGYFRGGVRLEELLEADIPTVHLDIASFKSFDAIREARRFWAWLKEHRIVVVHTFDYPSTVFAAPLARLSGVPVVLSSHRGHRDLIPSSYRQLVRLTDLFVDGIVVNCRATQEELIEREEIARAQTRLCYNGIDAVSFESAEPAAICREFPTGSLTVGCVSVFRSEKNLQLLLAAVARLIPVLPHLQVMLVGSGPEEECLRTLANDLNLASRCLFQPAGKNVASFLKCMDVFVLPSITEALSNSLMEAMAAGTPVIASRVGGTPELITDEATGLLFKEGDCRELAAKIRMLAMDAELRARLASNAQALVRQQFGLDKAADRMGSIYEEFTAAKVQDHWANEKAAIDAIPGQQT